MAHMHTQLKVYCFDQHTAQWHCLRSAVVQLSPPPISRTFLSSQHETLPPLNTNSMVPFPTAPNNCYATFCLDGFDCELWNRICHFCDWLVALSVMSSRSVHLGACVRIPFLLKVGWYSIVWIYHIFQSTHLSTGICWVVSTFWLFIVSSLLWADNLLQSF